MQRDTLKTKWGKNCIAVDRFAVKIYYKCSKPKSVGPFKQKCLLPKLGNG